MSDLTDTLRERVAEAAARGEALAIRGGATKSFYGRAETGEALEVGAHRGIVSYEPTELVITARAGTPLAEIESRLDEAGQMLAFEPPHFGAEATLGGAIACGLSGPRRPYAGAARDFVLGARIINGRGEVLSFGGEVMKNVAGYDASRLMAGALGTLGVLLEVSLKVLPRPAAERTLVQQRDTADAIETMNRWAARPLPITATAHDGERLFVRLAGAEPAVEAAATELGGEPVTDAQAMWRALREHRHPALSGDGPLWRLSLPPATPPSADLTPALIEWGGAQRWLRTGQPAAVVREAAAGLGGHAAVFRGGDRRGEVFHPPAAPVLELHRRLKRAFDPEGILNPGRLYPDL